MKKIHTTVLVDPEKQAQADKMGFTLTFILDKGLDQFINGIVIGDNIVLDRLKEKRKSLQSKAADLTVKEMTIRAKRENLETEIMAVSKEIGAIEGKREDDENSLRVTELLRSINNVIIDNDYDIKKIESIVAPDVAEMKTLMPSWELSKQIEIMKGFST